VDSEAEYNNRRRVPESGEISARWRVASASYRKTARADLDQPYGPATRHRYDLFFADGGAVAAPVVAYIHGGYWQWGDRTWHSRIAQELNAHGVDVALPSYSLCPAVSVIDIVAEMRMFLAVLWQRTRTHPLVVGHSAGGHLAGAMVATDWNTHANVPGDLVRAGVSISGLFDLEPLITTSMNDALRLDRETARAASPRFWPPPPQERTFVAVAGGLESSEFRRQSRDIVEHWGGAGVHAEYLESTGTNHYTVVDELTQPNTELFARVLTMARQVHAG
jgi:arylformamidase